jgi:hypothetical protein
MIRSLHGVSFCIVRYACKSPRVGLLDHHGSVTLL